MELIDKSAVVTEINRVLNSYDPNEITSGRYALVSLRDFLATLEVKETDDAYKQGYNDAIDKVCKWLKFNFNMPDDFEVHLAFTQVLL